MVSIQHTIEEETMTIHVIAMQYIIHDATAKQTILLTLLLLLPFTIDYLSLFEIKCWYRSYSVKKKDSARNDTSLISMW